MTPSDFAILIDPIKKRIMNFLSRGVVDQVDDSKGIQRVKASLYADEVQENLERFQNYGFTSYPKKGAEAITVFHSGNRDHGIVIAVDDRRYRLKGLAEGEVAIFTDEGDSIHLKRDNKIVITTNEITVNASNKTIINTGTAEVTAEKTTVTSPEVSIVSSTKVDITTPIMTVSGLIQCAGIGAGVTPVSGRAKIAGDIEASGNVKDSAGTMAQIRSTYNGHKHNTTDPVPNPLM